jgi:SAM-dependent methyltransferase
VKLTDVSLGRRTEPEPSSTLPLSSEWRDYFLRLLQRTPRFDGPRRFLQADLLQALRRLIPTSARVLEVGVGRGATLAGLPNMVRHGIDLLPEAVEQATALDASMKIVAADALSFRSLERYDAIVCDRLCHTVPDVQQLLENLSAHLTRGGRIFLTCFNFLWSVPLSVAAQIGVVEPSPEQNWLSQSDFENLFRLAELEPVRYEDRVLVPAQLPFLGGVVNRFGPHVPVLRLGALYRLYVLRRLDTPTCPPKVSVVIPARNEAGNIERAIRETPLMGAGTEIVFVEGGSSDGTYERIQELMGSHRGSVEIKLHKQQGKGKGDAVRLGFSKASGDLLMILDADLTVAPEDLRKFYEAMVRGLTDYAQGTRLVYPMENDAMRFLNKVGNTFFAKTFSFLLGQPIKDTLCGTKVLWRDDYQRIVQNRAFFGDFDPFGDFDLIFGASKLNLKILELPVRYRSRTYGETNIQRFRDGALLIRMCFLAARKLKFV